MQTSLSARTLNKLREPSELSPVISRRQPVHTVYGGAHLFSAATPAKLGRLAAASLSEYGGVEEFADIFELVPETAARVRAAIERKLQHEPVEDLRIDFEDGYGIRSAAEEDGHAESAAIEFAAAAGAEALPPFAGIRIRPIAGATAERSARTLDIFLTTLSRSGCTPANLIVTLPKVTAVAQVGKLALLLDEIESALGWQFGSVRIEVMVETAAALVSEDGRLALRSITEAGGGRVTGAHFGAFDYTAEFGVAAAYQDLRHPMCDQARHLMRLSLAGTGIFLADGVTTIMPVGRHRGDGLSAEQLLENAQSVRAGWRIHYGNIRHALASGFYQGWDLHPAQLVARYAAVYAFFFDGAEDASTRLRAFIEKGARANLVGGSFDDAATAQGMLNYFLRALDCKAFTEAEIEQMTGVPAEILMSGSFENIIGLAGSRP